MKFFLILFSISLFSCIKKSSSQCTKNVEIIIANNREENYSIIFSNGVDSILINAKEKSIVKTPLCFSKLLKIDGSYLVKIKNSKKDTTVNWGYYTNGAPIEKSIKLTLNNDSINFKSNYFTTYY